MASLLNHIGRRNEKFRLRSLSMLFEDHENIDRNMVPLCCETLFRKTLRSPNELMKFCIAIFLFRGTFCISYFVPRIFLKMQIKMSRRLSGNRADDFSRKIPNLSAFLRSGESPLLSQQRGGNLLLPAQYKHFLWICRENESKDILQY